MLCPRGRGLGLEKGASVGFVVHKAPFSQGWPAGRSTSHRAWELHHSQSAWQPIPGHGAGPLDPQFRPGMTCQPAPCLWWHRVPHLGSVSGSPK